MRLRLFLLALFLLTLLGLCTVRLVVRQTRAQYRMGKLLAEEEQIKQEMAQLKSAIAALRDPHRLETFNKENGDILRSLEPLPPVELDHANADNRRDAR